MSQETKQQKQLQMTAGASSPMIAANQRSFLLSTEQGKDGRPISHPDLKFLKNATARQYFHYWKILLLRAEHRLFLLEATAKVK
jgi:hypothetical protein